MKYSYFKTCYYDIFKFGRLNNSIWPLRASKHSRTIQTRAGDTVPLQLPFHHMSPANIHKATYQWDQHDNWLTLKGLRADQVILLLVTSTTLKSFHSYRWNSLRSCGGLAGSHSSGGSHFHQISDLPAHREALSHAGSRRTKGKALVQRVLTSSWTF